MSEKKLYAIVSLLFIIFLYSCSGLLRQLSNSIRQLVGDSLNVLVTVALLTILLFFIYFRRLAIQQERIVFTALLISCYGLAFWYLGIPEERLHLLQYGLLTYFFSRMMPDRIQTIPRYLLVVSLVTLVGVGDEIIQALRPDRVGDVRDVVINGFSALLAQSLFVVTSVPDATESTTSPEPQSLPNP
ncbi:MAG: VanZ family protein [Proteobacteria bacterium]|nr:VanZ family protein [Pseudomonadota bacterium]